MGTFRDGPACGPAWLSSMLALFEELSSNNSFLGRGGGNLALCAGKERMVGRREGRRKGDIIKIDIK